jgi:ABC-type lipoprotein export system ATPase subunit
LSYSPPKKILNDVNIHIPSGRLVAIMGGSGSGKTTLLNLIANRIPQTCLQPMDTTIDDNQVKRTSNFSEYSGTGQILFQGSSRSSLFLRKNIGYGESLFCLLYL